MRLNSVTFINKSEVNYFTVHRVTSIDIRVKIYFKNDDMLIARVGEENVAELENYLS